MPGETAKPMTPGTIFIIIIVTGAVVGALLGLLRNQLGGSALLTGGVAGLVVGLVASVLIQRRNRALHRQTRC